MADSIKGKLSSFDTYLKNLSELNNYRENFFSSYHAENSNFLNRKTKRSIFKDLSFVKYHKKKFSFKKN
jgi:hypothetical protein